MELSGGTSSHGREVEFATKGDVRLTRALAVLVAVSALVTAVVPLFTPLPWLVLLTAIVAVFLLVLAGGLWVSEAENAANTVRLQAQGIQGAAEIRDIDQQAESESISYRITFRVRAEAIDPFDVAHLCSHWKCVDAAKTHQAGQLAIVPAIVMPATGEWMILH